MARTTPIGRRRRGADDGDDGEMQPVGRSGTDDDIDALLESLTGDADHVVLWRVDGPKAKQEHVDKVPLSRFNAEFVKENHGGGDYLFRVYSRVKQGGGRDVMKYKEFSIDKSIPPKSGSAALEWRAREERNGKATAGNGSSERERASTDISPWAAVLAATLPAVASGLFTVLSKERTMDPVLGAVLQSMMTNKSNGTTIDPVELQRLIADERERAYNHGRDSAPRSESDDGTARVLEATLPDLINVFKESVQNDRARAATARTTPGTPSVPAAQPKGPRWLGMVRQYIPQLIQASKTVEPEALAARVLDTLPLGVVREVTESCLSEEFVSETLAELSELSSAPDRRAYFTAFLTAIQDTLAPAGELPDGEEEQGEGDDDEPAAEGQAGGKNRHSEG